MVRYGAVRAVGIPFLMAAIGFGSGYFAPIALCRDCADAPMNGIFITGPAGLFCGIIAVIIGRGLSSTAFRLTVLVTAVVIAVFGIVLAIPEPHIAGEVVRASIVRCDAPAKLVPAALSRWQGFEGRRSVGANPLSTVPRDDGVVLLVRVHSRKEFYRHRESWRYGTVTAGSWMADDRQEQVFARYAGSDCRAYTPISDTLFAKKWEASSVSPPANLPAFLGLCVVEPVTQDWSQGLVSSYLR